MTRDELIALLRDPTVVKALHSVSDVDRDLHSQHHSLGNRRNQAATGDHGHSDLNDSITALQSGKLDSNKVSYGTVTANVNASSQLTINHGLSGTPTSVQISLGGANGSFVRINTKTATDFTITIRSAANALLATGTSVTLDWVAFL